MPTAAAISWPVYAEICSLVRSLGISHTDSTRLESIRGNMSTPVNQYDKMGLYVATDARMMTRTTSESRRHKVWARR